MSIEDHKNICKELTVLYEAKNADYGDSFHKSYQKYGMIMPLIRLEDKLNRLESIVNSGSEKVKGESVRDTALDIANYAIMTIMELDFIDKNT